MSILITFQCDLCFRKVSNGITLIMEQKEKDKLDYFCTASKRNLLNPQMVNKEMIKHVCSVCAKYIKKNNEGD